MSKYKHITQTEARALRAKVHRLEETERQRRNAWTADYPEGTVVATLATAPDSEAVTAIRVARQLGHFMCALAQRKLERGWNDPVHRRTS